jgi:lipopolysaccharide export LptBFGC system permease protein LptF
MHPLRHPRNAALLGFIFIAIAIIYLVVPAALGQDLANLDIFAGVTMLLGLGIAMAIMAYVLVAGTRGE